HLVVAREQKFDQIRAVLASGSGHQSAAGHAFNRILAALGQRPLLASRASSFFCRPVGTAQWVDRERVPGLYFFIAFCITIESTLEIPECDHKACPAIPEA